MSEWTPPKGYEKIAKKPPERRVILKQETSIESPRELEARQKIATLAKQIHDLETIAQSLSIWQGFSAGVSWDQRWEREDYGNQIEELKGKLVDKHLEGEKPEQNEVEGLRRLERLKEEDDDFHGELNKKTQSRHLYETLNQGKEAAEPPEDIRALLEKLETLGISREEIQEQTRDSSALFSRREDVKIISDAVGQKKRELQKVINQERLELPGGKEEMIAEILKRGEFTEEKKTKEIEATFDQAARFEQYANAEHLTKEMFPLEDSNFNQQYILAYPVTVQRGVVEYLTKKALEKDRQGYTLDFIRKTAIHLGEYLEEYRRVQGIEYQSDITSYGELKHSFEKAEKLLERTQDWLKEEERYIMSLLKADIKIQYGKGGTRWDLEYLSREDGPKKLEWPLRDVTNESYNPERESSEEDRELAELLWKENRKIEEIIKEKREKQGQRLADGVSLDPLDLITAIRARIAATEEHLLETRTKREERKTAEAALKKKGQQKIDFAHQQIEELRAA